MQIHRPEQGVSLVELLVAMAVLTIILGGIYGLLSSAHKSYNHTSAKLESQQTARIVLDYLVFRLREIDAGRTTRSPYTCTNCHDFNMDDAMENHSSMPCVIDVSVPQRSPDILDIRKITFASLTEIPLEFQNMTGNFIRFKADLLPLHGFNETFTDANGNSAWDWTAKDVDTDINQDGVYNPTEAELLNDMNDNSRYDYYGETWTWELRHSSEGPYYELVETLNFTSLQPRTRKPNSKVLYDNSVYPANGYTSIPVAYGITGLWIAEVPRIDFANFSTARNEEIVDPTCSDVSTDARICHGSQAVNAAGNPDNRLNIYGNATSMDYARFVATHPWWNTIGLSVEVSTTNTRGQSQQFTKLREFVNFRNIEINQQ